MKTLRLLLTLVAITASPALCALPDIPQIPALLEFHVRLPALQAALVARDTNAVRAAAAFAGDPASDAFDALDQLLERAQVVGATNLYPTLDANAAEFRRMELMDAVGEANLIRSAALHSALLYATVTNEAYHAEASDKLARIGAIDQDIVVEVSIALSNLVGVVRGAPYLFVTVATAGEILENEATGARILIDNFGDMVATNVVMEFAGTPSTGVPPVSLNLPDIPAGERASHFFAFSCPTGTQLVFLFGRVRADQVEPISFEEPVLVSPP
jgi:hypothetical protein